MSREKKAFVSFHPNDAAFFDFLRRSLRKKNIIAFDRNLYNHCNERASRLFSPTSLDRELSHPDFAFIILSEHYSDQGNTWFGDELRALYMLEQFRRTTFIIPLLIGQISEETIPSYLKEHPERMIDFRGKSHEEALKELIQYVHDQVPGKIFIGHGRSPEWKDLRDYLEDRLGLECDEFEAVPVAGKSIKERLSEMLEVARFAFLVMTAEDEHSDQTKHARENVIHEAGLFQGKLGFERAIILLEKGCEEFSNKSGVVHIAFSRGEMKACFIDIREILDREGILT